MPFCIMQPVPLLHFQLSGIQSNSGTILFQRLYDPHLLLRLLRPFPYVSKSHPHSTMPAIPLSKAAAPTHISIWSVYMLLTLLYDETTKKHRLFSILKIISALLIYRYNIPMLYRIAANHLDFTAVFIAIAKLFACVMPKLNFRQAYRNKTW